MAAVKRLREELAELQVEINEEKSRIVDLRRGESFGFLGFDFRRVRSLRGVRPGRSGFSSWWGVRKRKQCGWASTKNWKRSSGRLCRSAGPSTCIASCVQPRANYASTCASFIRTCCILPGTAAWTGRTRHCFLTLRPALGLGAVPRLRATLRDGSGIPTFVFLNACRSGFGAQSSWSVQRTFMSAGVQASLGMQVDMPGQESSAAPWFRPMSDMRSHPLRSHALFRWT